MSEIKGTDASGGGEASCAAEWRQIERAWRDAGLMEAFLGNGGSNSRLYHFVDKVRALASAPPAGQGDGAIAGWKLVPVEPTEDMLDAYWRQTGESHEMRSRTKASAQYRYRAMIASAPPAPTPEAGSDLAGLATKAHRGLLGNEHFRDELRGTGGIAPECEDRLAAVTCAPVMPSTSWLIGRMANTSRGRDDNAAYLLLHAAKRLADLSHVVEVALSSSPSPPPAEDLAGQGEPVACEEPDTQGGR